MVKFATVKRSIDKDLTKEINELRTENQNLEEALRNLQSENI